MSHQTGITASDKLKKFLGKCRDGRYRLLKICISDSGMPQLELEESREGSSSWDKDWDKYILPSVDPDQPTYFLYRLDEKDGSENFLWLLISWSPDHAHTRQKMLYASTKATLKKEFGQGQIKDEYFASTKEELTLRGYEKHMASMDGPGVLSQQELEMKEIKETETRVDIGVDTKQQTMSSLMFPMQKEALSALESFRMRSVDYLQLAIDIPGEKILLTKDGVYNAEELPKLIPTESARYHLFRYKHVHQGEATASVLFIYSMPGYSVSIKERMLYSSCKNSLVDTIQNQFNIEISRKVEIETGSELTEAFLQNELHPIAQDTKPKFAKPAMPNRGRKRLTKAPPS
eukprot:TRINITY_DN7271_c0_g2_i1.p1 TRINITY_DN7271_c0_g2~~TRINITY_DN7271_c0_g2_i1.p1  ORF type:complete len:357 (+),score=90.93 TRINITY_DN7271_c0_g2_i1:32-1072(+)